MSSDARITTERKVSKRLNQDNKDSRLTALAANIRTRLTKCEDSGIELDDIMDVEMRNGYTELSTALARLLKQNVHKQSDWIEVAVIAIQIAEFLEEKSRTD